MRIIVSRTAHCSDRDGTRSNILHHVLEGCDHCKSPTTAWSSVKKAVQSIVCYVSTNQLTDGTDPVEACVRPGVWVSPNTLESEVVAGGSQEIGGGQEEGEEGQEGETMSGLGECHGAHVSDVESGEEDTRVDISPNSEESEEEEWCSRGRGTSTVLLLLDCGFTKL